MNFAKILGLAVVVIACSAPENKDHTASIKDSVPKASAEKPVLSVVQTPLTDGQAEPLRDGIVTIEKTDTIMSFANQWSFISDPYDFALDVSSVQQLLDDEAKVEQEDFEGGEEYNAYSYYTITYEGSKMNFYSYPGKHFSEITTSMLPLKLFPLLDSPKDTGPLKLPCEIKLER